MAEVNGDIQWSFSQVKGSLDDDITEGELWDMPRKVRGPSGASGGGRGWASRVVAGGLRVVLLPLTLH